MRDVLRRPPPARTLPGVPAVSSLAAVAAAYLLGAVPFSWVLGQIALGMDLRTIGSGNVGATNLSRAAPGVRGALLFAAAFLLDSGKGAAAVLGSVPLCGALGAGAPPSTLPVACGAAAILGHSFSVFLGGRGGKSVAVSAGVFASLMPIAAACASAVFGIALLLSRMVSAASVAAAAALPVAYALLPAAATPRSDAVAALAVAAPILVAWRHRANLRRILAGSEPRIGRGTDPPPSP